MSLDLQLKPNRWRSGLGVSFSRYLPPIIIDACDLFHVSGKWDGLRPEAELDLKIQFTGNRE